jgi:hypothetical protein
MYQYFKIIFFFGLFSMNAQIHEIGIFAGGSNYIGDIGSTNYIVPNQQALGVLYKWNKNPRLAYRFSLNTASLAGNDTESSDVGRNQRKYQFTNKVKEASLGVEFNFFDFNLHDGKKKYTPYVQSGLNYLQFNDSYLDIINNEVLVVDKKLGAFAIPFTVGIKSNITTNWILAFEVGSRYTFTDNLEGSNPIDKSLKKFGNINNNDWYVFSGITLTYTFGIKPCFCAE